MPPHNLNCTSRIAIVDNEKRCSLRPLLVPESTNQALKLYGSVPRTNCNNRLCHGINPHVSTRTLVNRGRHLLSARRIDAHQFASLGHPTEPKDGAVGKPSRAGLLTKAEELGLVSKCRHRVNDLSEGALADQSATLEVDHQVAMPNGR